MPAADTSQRPDADASASHPLDRTPPQTVFERHFELRRSASVLILGLLSTVLLTISFPPFDVWPVAYVALVPWTLAVIGGARPRLTVLTAWLAGAAFWAIVLYWLLLPTVGGAVATVLYLSLYWLGMAVVIRKAMRRNLPAWLVLPLVWVACEFIRAYVISGFPWFYLAQTQYARTSLIQITDLTGQYGVSFFVAMVNGLLVDVLSAPLFVHGRRGVAVTRRIPIGAGLCVVMLAGMLVYGTWRMSQDTRRPGPRLGVVQQAVPISLQGRERTDVDVMLDHLDRALSFVGSDRDAILFPETMLPTGLNPDVLSLTPGDLDDASAGSLGEKLLGRGASRIFTPPQLRDVLAREIGRAPMASYLPKAMTLTLTHLVEPAGFAELSLAQLRRIGEILFGDRAEGASDAALRAATGAFIKDYAPHESAAVDAEASRLLQAETIDAWRQRQRFGYQQASETVLETLRGQAAVIQAVAILLDAPIIGGVSAVVRNERPTGPQDIWVYRNATMRMDPLGLSDEQYAKMHLVPFSEYVPFKYSFPAFHKLLRSFVPTVMPQLEPGREPRRNVLTTSAGTFEIGTMICYEGTFARVGREIVRAGPKDALVLANLSNDGWFTHRGSFGQWLAAGFANDPQAGPWQGTTEQAQHLSQYVFRAIETRVPVVRAVNTGISASIDANGRIESVVEQAAGDSRQNTMIAGELAIRPLVDARVSVYSLVGDLFAITVTVAAGILVAWMIWRKPT